MSNYHTPVLAKEVVESLHVGRGKKYIDATLGGGGHGWEITKLGGILLGIDADKEAVEHTSKEFRTKNLELRSKENWKIVQGNFRNIETIAKENGFEKVDGVVFDLGVSSHQLDTPARGFSYRFTDAPLDLRLNQNEGESAITLLQRASREELYEIFATFGEEERAGAIADAICRTRRVNPITTVGDVTAVITSVLPEGAGKQAVLSRVFQAMRIAVNEELAALREGLQGAMNILVPGGRLAVISFHSLEDRIVKTFFKSKGIRSITKAPVWPTEEEIMRNRRSRSAKLRIGEKL